MTSYAKPDSFSMLTIMPIATLIALNDSRSKKSSVKCEIRKACGGQWELLFNG